MGSFGQRADKVLQTTDSKVQLFISCVFDIWLTSALSDPSIAYVVRIGCFGRQVGVNPERTRRVQRAAVVMLKPVRNSRVCMLGGPLFYTSQ